jgi:hypothetical protein
MQIRSIKEITTKLEKLQTQLHTTLAEGAKAARLKGEIETLYWVLGKEIKKM